MTDEDIKRLAKAMVHEVLQGLGIDIDDPLEFQKDMAHVRAWRRSTEKVKDQTLMAAIGIVVAGFLGALWLGIKMSIR